MCNAAPKLVSQHSIQFNDFISGLRPYRKIIIHTYIEIQRYVHTRALSHFHVIFDLLDDASYICIEGYITASQCELYNCFEMPVAMLSEMWHDI